MALIRSVFQEELDSVSQSLVDLTNMVSESIHKATDSLIKADLNLAEEVISYDEKSGLSPGPMSRTSSSRWLTKSKIKSGTASL